MKTKALPISVYFTVYAYYNGLIREEQIIIKFDLKNIVRAEIRNSYMMNCSNDPILFLTIDGHTC